MCVNPDLEKIKSYIDSFRFGAPPHGGGGIGKQSSLSHPSFWFSDLLHFQWLRKGCHLSPSLRPGESVHVVPGPPQHPPNLHVPPGPQAPDPLRGATALNTPPPPAPAGPTRMDGGPHHPQREKQDGAARELGPLTLGSAALTLP